MRSKLDKFDIFADPRFSDEIDVSKEPDLYFAKLAIEYHGTAVRDNRVDELIEIGMEIERGESE